MKIKRCRSPSRGVSTGDFGVENWRFPSRRCGRGNAGFSRRCRGEGSRQPHFQALVMQQSRASDGPVENGRAAFGFDFNQDFTREPRGFAALFPPVGCGRSHLTPRQGQSCPSQLTHGLPGGFLCPCHPSGPGISCPRLNPCRFPQDGAAPGIPEGFNPFFQAELG